MAHRQPTITVREDFTSGLATMFVDGKPRATMSFVEVMEKAKWDYSLTSEQLFKIETDYKADIVERAAEA